jgi:hypothetical protein
MFAAQATGERLIPSFGCRSPGLARPAAMSEELRGPVSESRGCAVAALVGADA